MKKAFLLSIALGLFALPLHAQNVWSSKIDTFGNFVVLPSNPNANGVVSVFTPASNITVTRIQLASPAGQIGCSPLPGIKVTNGTSTVFLAIPNTTATNGSTGPVSNDTGVISVPFSAGTQIRLKAVPGGNGCNPYEINIVVQYSITP
jgi:hypothetical protein